MDKLHINEGWGCSVEKRLYDQLPIKGVFGFEHYRLKPYITKHPDIFLEDCYDRVGFHPIINTVTNAGKMQMLGSMFNSNVVSTIYQWYMGLINNSGFSAIAAADTMASHAGWTEFVSYTETTRPAWTKDAASGNAITATSPSVFTISADGTLYGGFIVSNNTKSGGTGILWSAGGFPTPVPVQASVDIFRGNYETSL